MWCRWVVVFYRDCSCHRPWMYYQYICDVGEEKSLWDGCSSNCLRVAICYVGLAAWNFGNGRVVLCTWETIIASSGLQLLWEGLDQKMGIVAKCPISLKMTPLKGRGCTCPSFSAQICRACLAIGIEYQLLLTYTLRLSIMNLYQLNSGVCESFKKTGNGGKSSFWSPPVSLGSTKFSKTCIACTTYSKFPYPFTSNIVFIV